MAEHNDPVTGEPQRTDDGSTDALGGTRFVALVTVAAFVASLSGFAVAYTQFESVDAAAAKATEWVASDDAADGPEFGEFHEISGLVINPASTDGRRYLMVDIGLEGDEETISAIEDREVVVRDRINNMLGEYSPEHLSDISERSTIKEQLRDDINEVLSEGHVQELYFTQYVLQ